MAWSARAFINTSLKRQGFVAVLPFFLVFIPTNPRGCFLIEESFELAWVCAGSATRSTATSTNI